MFRISQTQQKLQKDNIKSEKNANMIHYKVGSKIRDTIKDLGGVLPEELPTPEKLFKTNSKRK